MAGYRRSDTLGTRIVHTRDTYRQVFPTGPLQEMGNKLTWNEYRLRQAEIEKRARKIADAATSHMRLEEDKPL